ncbi:MAG: right-handed parallel beta-helix repeat-containing protein, partial [Thermoplasmata archaeon]|nr:right-handed parallel beta-helix repeat-containing protein [Thermoplasmata archaeon]
MTGVQSYRWGWIVLVACAIFLLLIAIAHSSEDASAATLVVPDNYPTIQGAIDSAKDGDVVDVRRGTYGGRITIDRSITLKGATVGSTIIEVDTSDAILTLGAKDILVSNIEILGSDGSIGIYANDRDDCRLIDVSVRGCGYGIYIEHGSYLEIKHCSVRY